MSDTTEIENILGYAQHITVTPLQKAPCLGGDDLPLQVGLVVRLGNANIIASLESEAACQELVDSIRTAMQYVFV